MIIKIQKSIASSEGPQVLIYDKEKTFVYEQLMCCRIAKLFKNGEIKIFHHAKIVDTKIDIGKRAPAQDW